MEAVRVPPSAWRDLMAATGTIQPPSGRFEG
jgi:hypothetical protein